MLPAPGQEGASLQIQRPNLKSLTGRLSRLWQRVKVDSVAHGKCVGVDSRVGIRWGCRLIVNSGIGSYTPCYLLDSASAERSFGKGADVFCFLSSLPLLPAAITACSVWLLPVISLLLTNMVSRVGACLSIWFGEVSWEPKRRQAWVS